MYDMSDEHFKLHLPFTFWRAVSCTSMRWSFLTTKVGCMSARSNGNDWFGSAGGYISIH
jgi:hypothetical protein